MEEESRDCPKGSMHAARKGSGTPAEVIPSGQGTTGAHIRSAVRQGLPQGCAAGGVGASPTQPRFGRHRRKDHRGHRGRRGGSVSRRVARGAGQAAVPALAGTAGVHSQARWAAKAPGYPSDTGSRRPGGGAHRDRTAVRSELLPWIVRVPAQAGHEAGDCRYPQSG